jgi:putative ATPase
MAPNGVLLYLDEIQSFNKKQQQSLLEHIENGKITLIASTTENPYFYVFNAILSRSTVFEFKQISAEAALKAVERAVAFLEDRTALKADAEEGALQYIASACGGDLRKAMNAVEVLFSAAVPTGDRFLITLDDAKAVTQKSALRADRDGDNHYDLLSALQKSIRGSDPDAAVHYLARLLEAGQMQAACRRLMVIAAEDVGLAYPMIIPIVNAAVDMALKLGMPEARIALGDVAVLMATSPKSNTGHVALDTALEDVRKGKGGSFPRHLQNMHADTYTQEREQGYKYPHNYPGRWVEQQYLPDDLVGKTYYTYGDNKLEQTAMQYWNSIKKK